MTTFIGEQDRVRQDYLDENVYKVNRYTWRFIFCNTAIQGWAFIVLFASVVPFLIYYLVVDRETLKEIETDTCYVNQTFRVPCGKVNITENDCVHLSCCYDKSRGSCYHYLPSRYSYNFLDGVYKASRSNSPFNTRSIDTMKLSVKEIDESRVSIYLHRDSDEIPSGTIEGNKNYFVNKTEIKLMVEIFRPNGDLLLSTAKGPLIASENYWEWTLFLTEDSIFGINKTLIRLDENSMFTKVFYNNKNDQSSMPLFWAYSKGQFHGVSINHDGPLEMTVLPSNTVVLKTITSGVIEVNLSVGTTPSLLHDQQKQANVSDLPYWIMGTHICKKQEQYYNMSHLVEHFTIDSTADSYCIDENLFMYLSNDDVDDINKFDVLNECLQKLSSQGKKFLLSIPPQILENSTLYNSAKDLSLLYEFNGTAYKGKYLDQHVVYPDFVHPNNQKYIEHINSFLSDLNVTIDGIILKDNWPVNDDFVMDNISFPYMNTELQDAMSYTIQWNISNNNVLHINSHNSYGLFQYNAFKKFYDSINDTKVLISATKFLTQIDTTIIQNVNVSWDNLRDHLSNLLFNSMVGNHLVGLPVCGDTNEYDDTYQDSLCLRWYLVAATMPLFRVSTPLPFRNPDDMKDKYDQNMAINFVAKRRRLVPYYYAIINQSKPVLRPMFYDYYENTTTFAMDKQYMIGEKILIAHPLTPDRTKLQIYLPPTIGVWYELWGGEMFRTNRTNNCISLDIINTDFIAFIAQGSILPLVDKNQIDLITALNCTGNVTAKGSVLINDIQINFEATDQNVTITSTSTELNYTLGHIKLYSYDNSTGYIYNYTKNVIITNGTTIFYEDPTTTVTSTQSTTTEITTKVTKSPNTTTGSTTSPTEPSTDATTSSELPTTDTKSTTAATGSTVSPTESPTNPTEPSTDATTSSELPTTDSESTSIPTKSTNRPTKSPTNSTESSTAGTKSTELTTKNTASTTTSTG